MRFLFLLAAVHHKFTYSLGGIVKHDCETYSDVDGTCFGKQLKQKWFILNSTYHNFNHGSYGTVPKPVAQRQQEYYLECEQAPDIWFRTKYYDKIIESREALAKFLNAEVSSLVLVENASAAVNSILRSIGLKKGDKVLRLSTAYGMVINTIKWLVETIGIEEVIVDVEFPMTSSKQILDSVQSALQSNTIALSIFSHISSVPAVIEPVSELMQLSHQYGALVLIDGAHAPGAIALDLTKLAPDFYLGNAHKWLFSPKGTAFLFVKPTLQTSVSPEPSVINLDPSGLLPDRFKYTGTRDYTAMSTLPTAIDFMEITLGGSNQVLDYNNRLAIDGANYLVKKWNTSLLVPESMTGTMSNIILPTTDGNAVNYLSSTLLSEYNTMVVAASVLSHGTYGETIYFLRLSAQVYLQMSDIEWLAELILKVLSEYVPNNTT